MKAFGRYPSDADNLDIEHATETLMSNMSESGNDMDRREVAKVLRKRRSNRKMAQAVDKQRKVFAKRRLKPKRLLTVNISQSVTNQARS